MPKFIVIEIDENATHQEQADQIYRSQCLFEDESTEGPEKWTRFETVTTMNHLELSDVVKEIKKVDE